MWEPGCHNSEVKKSTLDELNSVKGTITDEEAKIWFAKFCQHSLYFTTKLLTGVELDEWQEIKLRAMFLRDFCLNIEGRGVGKSYTISIFIILYALFHPGVKLGICSGTFRQSKLIFKQIEKFVNAPEGKFLKQCIRTIRREPDAYEIIFTNGSSAHFLPLTDKIRGFRFNKVIIDEYLLVPTEIVNTVIGPFLAVKQTTLEQDKIKELEDKLIAAGVMKETERRLFPSNSIIGLSSASYKFEPLYRDLYLPYIDRIMDPEATDVNHLIFKLSYEAVPKRMDNKAIEEARATSSRAQFSREYQAQFTDESGGFFNYKSLQEATVPVDCKPLIKLKGTPGTKYIISIDPNYSESETADHFAMSLIELNEETRSGSLVHAYATAQTKINERSKYFQYLLTNFNIVYIIADNAGGPRFISDAEQFLGAFPQEISSFEDTFLDGEEGLRLARMTYNPATGKIIHYQCFNKGNWIRQANETLQYHIEHKKILFGGRIHDKTVDAALNTVFDGNIRIEDLKFSFDCDKTSGPEEKKMDFIDHLNEMIDLTKKELTLIEVTSNASGHQTFDLPSNLKTTKDPRRARRDSYSALLLASWALKCYYDMAKEPTATEAVFKPFFIGKR